MSVMHSTSDAAERLGISETRVRALIAAGTLKATRFSGRWIIDDASLALLAARDRPVGHRAMSPRVAWAVAALLDDQRAPWILGSQRSRLKPYLTEKVGVATWLARLARRADGTFDFRMHQHSVATLLADSRVRRSGADFLEKNQRGLVGGFKRANIWVARDDLDSLRVEYGILKSSLPNLRVRVLPSEVALCEEALREVPRLVSAADLWDEGDARSRGVAADIIDQVQAGHA